MGTIREEVNRAVKGPFTNMSVKTKSKFLRLL